MKITRAYFVIAKKTVRSLRLFVVLSRAVTIVHDDCQKMKSLAHNLIKGKLSTECKSQLNGDISTK